MRVDIKKLDASTVIPNHSTAFSAGYDLRSTVDINIKAHKTVKIGTGIALAIPPHHFGALFSRSGLSTNKGLRLANCVGIIDSDYRGEIIVPIYNDSNETQLIKKGERIAQIIIIPYIDAEFHLTNQLVATSRNVGGFGSTGE